VVFGVNDTLRAGFSAERVSVAANRTVGALRSGGAEVLTMRLPDPGQMLGLPGALARPLARRAGVVNAVMDEVAQRFGTLHFDAAGDPATRLPEMWAADRLHPSERGHRLIARRFHDQLAQAGHPLGPAPAPEPGNPPPTRLAEFAWLATKGTAWVLRRSTDLVPYLLAMAVKELCAGARGDGQSTVAALPAPAAPGRSQRGEALAEELLFRPVPGPGDGQVVGGPCVSQPAKSAQQVSPRHVEQVIGAKVQLLDDRERGSGTVHLGYCHTPVERHDGRR
jgi:hypothetical protein